MTTIRYQREGLRVVRVTTPTPEGQLPADAPAAGGEGPAALQAEVDALRAQGERAAAVSEDLRKRIGRFARAVRHDAAVRRRLFPKTVAAPAPPHGVTGEQQRRAREALGLSQRELAAQFALHRSQIAEAERGRRRVNARLAPWVRQTLRVGAAEAVDEVTP